MNFKYVPKKVEENTEKMKIIEDCSKNTHKSKIIIDKGDKKDLTLKSPQSVKSLPQQINSPKDSAYGRQEQKSGMIKRVNRQLSYA